MERLEPLTPRLEIDSFHQHPHYISSTGTRSACVQWNQCTSRMRSQTQMRNDKIIYNHKHRFSHGVSNAFLKILWYKCFSSVYFLVLPVHSSCVDIFGNSLGTEWSHLDQDRYSIICVTHQGKGPNRINVL